MSSQLRPLAARRVTALLGALLLCTSLSSLSLSSSSLCLMSSAEAAPRASELALMRAKGDEVERVSRERVELLFGRLCPGRCELLEVKAQISEPKPVGQVMPGFDAPTASEVKVNSVEAKIMIDSSLPRSFRSNLPQMVQHRLSDLSNKVIVTPIQLQFPKPQLPPSPPMMPEAKPQPAPPAPPAPEPEPKVEEPAPAPSPAPIEKAEEPWSALELLPYAFALLFALLLWALWRQLSQLDGALKELQAGGEPSAGREDQERELGPELDELRARLSASREVSNEALRTWLKEDVVEVATLSRMLGSRILSDLKLDPSLSDEISRVSEHVRRQRAPVPHESAWRVAHALEARLTASELLARERALRGSWDFLQSATPAELYELYRGLSYAEQGHLLSQLPHHLRGRFLDRLSAEERKQLVLYASAERPLSREASLELSYQLKRLLQERSGAEGDAGAHLDLVLEMLSTMPFSHQVNTLQTLDEQRPELAEAALSSMCLEGVIAYLPAEVLTEALILSPFEDALTMIRGLEPSLQTQLISALPAQRASLYLDELPIVRDSDHERLPAVRASFLQKVMVSAQRSGHKISELNRAAMRSSASTSI